ncbi:ABC transporter substrate-binding protein [Micromonospora sp. NPDC050397]|uniref:ABC transporter substrate-binding protein n=1 Tax=Micromonospora sp. NPDC050397 TaxID=3364279 RepID=UPI00384ABF87
MRQARRRVLAAFATIVVLASTGCSSDDATGVIRGGVKGGEPVTVAYLPGFGIIGQDAYMYVAQEKGYFAEAGLKVEIRPGQGTENNLSVLVSGKATFATVDMSGALMAYAKESGFRAVAAVYQRSVSSITTLEGRGITRPQDLEGRRIGYQPGGVNYTLFDAYAKAVGIDAKKVRWQQTSPDQLRPLLGAGKFDAVTETVIGTPGVEAFGAGRKAVVLPYSDVLSDLYGNVIVASTKTVDTNPDLVRRFRQAAVKGLMYAIDHPDEAGAIFHRHQPAYPAATAAAETRLMISYVRANGPDMVGAFDPSRVARGIALLQGVGKVAPGITPEQIVAFDLNSPVATPK